MKIAMIGQKGVATKSGGVERHVEEIARYLVNNGHEVTVYYRNTFLSKNIEEYKGIHLKRIKTLNFKWLDAIIYTLSATIDALKNKYDIYHYHALGPGSLCFIPKIFSKRVIVTIHGLDYKRKKWGIIGRLYLWLSEHIVCKCADEVISVSKKIQYYIIDKYKKRNEKNTVFIENGVNTIPKRNVELIKKYMLEEEEYILFLGRLTPEKGIHYLIKAYENLKNKKKLVIAGGSSYTDKYISRLKKMAGNNSNIIFTGDVSGNVLEELYSNCAFYILPSDVEGMPISLLEALSCGKYCIVSDIEENTDIINDESLGITFKKGDINDLQLKIQKVLDEELYKYNCDLRKKYVNMHYNWNSAGEKVVKIYLFE